MLVRDGSIVVAGGTKVVVEAHEALVAQAFEVPLQARVTAHSCATKYTVHRN